MLFVKYEDLKDDRELIFKKIINFIESLKGNDNYNIDKNRFYNSVNSTNFINLRNKENNEGFEESYINKEGKRVNFFNMGFKNDWRKLLPKEIIDKINIEFKKELGELGYD